MNIIIISGRSGAGKSVALQALEDMGYYCVDNLPLALLPKLIAQLEKKQTAVAISLDIRNLPDSPDILEEVLQGLEHQHRIEIIFLECQRNVLIRRYSDSRRLHPLSHHQLSLESAIDSEAQHITPLLLRANMLVDTSTLSTHELAAKIRQYVLGVEDKNLNIIVESFGFKYGLPLDADYIFDVRFLPNPHWEPELRPFTGLDECVANYLQEKVEVRDFIQKTTEYLHHWLPYLEANNRSYLTIAIGCTGGKHRSVYITEQIGAYFRKLGKNVQIKHKTLDK